MPGVITDLFKMMEGSAYFTGQEDGQLVIGKHRPDVGDIVINKLTAAFGQKSVHRPMKLFIPIGTVDQACGNNMFAGNHRVVIGKKYIGGDEDFFPRPAGSGARAGRAELFPNS